MRIFIFLMAFFCSSVFATQIPVPESPRYVNDLTGKLTNDEVNTLTNQIKELTQKSHAQLVVLVVETTGDETIEQYATRVFDSWKPGDKDRDDGVLLLVAWQDHTVRIEIGYGLEGVITDAQSGKIIRNSIIPAFKNGDLAGGLQKGISDIDNRLTGNNLATITPPDHPLPFNGWWALLVWAIVLTFISARGYFKTLGLICFTAIVLAFVLPIAGFSGSWEYSQHYSASLHRSWLSLSLLPPSAKRFGIRCVVPTDRHVTKEVTRPPGVLHHRRHLPLHPLLTMIISAAAAVHLAAVAPPGAGNKRN